MLQASETNPEDDPNAGATGKPTLPTTKAALENDVGDGHEREPTPKAVEEEPSMDPAKHKKDALDNAPKKGRPPKSKAKAKAKAAAKTAAKSKAKAKATASPNKSSTATPKGKAKSKSKATPKRKASASKAKDEAAEDNLKEKAEAVECEVPATTDTKPARRRLKRMRTSQVAASEMATPEAADNATASVARPAGVRKRKTRTFKPPKNAKGTSEPSTLTPKQKETKERNARKSKAYRRAHKKAQDEGLSPKKCKEAAKKVL